MTERRRGSVVVSTDCYQEVARSLSLCIILNYQTATYGGGTVKPTLEDHSFWLSH